MNESYWHEEHNLLANQVNIMMMIDDDDDDDDDGDVDDDVAPAGRQ